MFNSIHQLISIPSDEVYRVGDGGADHAVVLHMQYSCRLMRKMYKKKNKNGTKMGHPKKTAYFFQKPTNKGVKKQKIKKKVPIFKKWAL